MSKGKFSKGVVALVLGCNILFAIGVLWVFLKTGGEPSALVGCWFGFTTAELWNLAAIKKRRCKDAGGEKI